MDFFFFFFWNKNVFPFQAALDAKAAKGPPPPGHERFCELLGNDLDPEEVLSMTGSFFFFFFFFFFSNVFCFRCRC